MSDEAKAPALPLDVEAVTIAPAKNKGGRPKGAKRSAKKLTQNEIAIVVTQAAQGTPQKAIAERMGLSEPAVSQLLAKFLPALNAIPSVAEIRAVKGELLEVTEFELLKSMNDEQKLKDARIGELGKAYSEVFKANRLVQGQSTANIEQKVTRFTNTGKLNRYK